MSSSFVRVPRLLMGRLVLLLAGAQLSACSSEPPIECVPGIVVNISTQYFVDPQGEVHDVDLATPKSTFSCTVTEQDDASFDVLCSDTENVAVLGQGETDSIIIKLLDDMSDTVELRISRGKTVSVEADLLPTAKEGQTGCKYREATLEYGATHESGGSGGMGGTHDCQKRSPSDCEEASGCAAGQIRRLEETNGAWCVPPLQTWAKTDVCYGLDDPQQECPDGDAVGYWRNRAGDVFQFSTDCGFPGFERIPAEERNFESCE